MNAVLLVTKGKNQMVKTEITRTPFLIGRAKDCGLSLDEDLASRQHTEITLERGVYQVRDNGSRNGTLVNGEKITGPRQLKDGDEIEIGSTRIKFIFDGSVADADDDDKTRVASANLEEKLPGLNVTEKKQLGDIRVKLRVVEGPLSGGIFKDWESPLTIGRSLTNHVVLVDDAVSSNQAQIIQEGDSYYIKDLNSSNGTFLDGIKVQKNLLSNGQKIKIGISTLVFERTDLRANKRKMMMTLYIIVGLLVVAALVKVLQPKDVAGMHIARAEVLGQQGEWLQASNEYQIALSVDPNRSAAKVGLTQAKEVLEAKAVLAMAEQEAAAENYDKAQDLVYRVLRDFPNSSGALELQEVIKSIENAKIAFASQNWTDAKRLLEKAQEKYPNSKLIQTRLDQAQKELTAQQNLAKASDAMDHQQLDLAQPLLQSIPDDSVYYIKAKQDLDVIAENHQVAVYLNKAQNLYQNGNISDALKQVAAGLQNSANNATLLALQTHYRQMGALIEPLNTAKAMGQPDDVGALLQYRKTCNDIIALEPDTLNNFRKSAEDTLSQVNANLAQAAQAAVTKATASTDRKEALRLLNLAVQATPDNQDFVTQRDQLKSQIVADCRDLYQKGIVHEDLGQVDMARDAFQQIINIGIPNEDYYMRAQRKLKGYAQ